MYRTVAINIGFKVHTLKKVMTGDVSINELLQERDSFVNTVRLILNTLPYHFDVTLTEQYDDNSSTLLVEIENDFEDVTQWLKCWYCSDDATDSELNEALQKAENDISACTSVICNIVAHYDDRYSGNLLIHLND